MNIADFARGRGVDPQAVSKYINRHRGEFEGLIAKEGKSIILSDEALDILEKAYPLPKPIEVVVDHESRDQLIGAQKTIIQLQRQLADQAALLADSKLKELLIEQRDEEIERRKAELSEKTKELAERDSRLVEKEAEILALREQLNKAAGDAEAERSRRERMEQAGFIARLFKTW